MNQRGWSKTFQNPPATTVSSRRQRKAARVASGGSQVSACRNITTSPRAWLAPSRICAPRPGGLDSTRPPNCSAMAQEASWLPPSTTRISRIASFARARRSVSGKAAASFSTGTTMETVRRSSDGIKGASRPHQ